MDIAANQIPFKYSRTLVVVLLSFLTLGMYIAYWFLTRKEAIQTIAGKNRALFRWWIFFMIFLSLSFILFFADAYLFTPYGRVVMESVNVILVYYFLGLLYYSVFRITEQLEDYYEELRISRVLLFFFHFWYLQFKINQLHKEAPEEKVPGEGLA
ncbi:hypothetical protein GCM10008986_25310 [Salinibacillus aidingensis]|uniref:DUF4234 domain-containing protein n=1 Tax=Salinibacillus aidingensis TaxID=237684 RepID=A0ABP3LBH3_9BACI